MPRYRIRPEKARSVELPGGVALFAGVAGREEATVAQSAYMDALVASGTVEVIDPDAPAPPALPIRDPLYRRRDTGELEANEGGSIWSPVSAGSGSADGKVIYGDGAPGAGTGADGDSYVDQAAHRLYGPKTAGAWPGTYQDLGGVSDGKTIYGAGAPSSGTGNDGDSYIDTTNNRLYGPKAAGAWPGTYIALGAAGSLPTATAGQLGVTELGGTPAYLPYPVSSRAIDDIPVIGRSWASRFLYAEEDAAMFAISGMFARATDANNVSVLRHTVETFTADRASTTSPILTNVVITGGAVPSPGDLLSGTGIPAGAMVLAYDAAAATVTMNLNATATGAAVSTVIEPQIMTNERDLRDWELLVKYLPKSTTSASAAYARGYGCYSGPSNFWRAAKRYHTTAGAKSEVVESVVNGSATTGTYVTDADTIQGVPRMMRVRKVGDAILYKHFWGWIKDRGNWSAAATYAAGDRVQWNDGGGVGAAHNHQFVAAGAIAPTATNPNADGGVNWRPAEEPDWQYVRRLRAAAGASSLSSTIDNPDVGRVGFGLQRLTADIYEFSVTELVRRPDAGLIVNPALRHTESVDLVPLYWSRNNAPSGGNTADIVDVLLPGDTQGNPDGYTRKAFHFNHTVTQSNFWSQTIYNARFQGAAAGATRVRRHPLRDIARRYFITGWSKGLNIVDTAPSANRVAASLDVYYYSRESSSVNPTDTNSLGNYFWALGPDGPLGHGEGTWDWHFFAFPFTLQVPEQVAYMNPQVGLHDSATGELWVADLHLAPVA